MRGVLAIFLLFSAILFAKDPLKAAGEFYFSQGDFKKALALWEKVNQRDPKNVEVLLRLAELRLHSEGRSAIEATLIQYLESNPEIPESATKVIKKKVEELQELFLTDQGQSKYLQAKTRIRQKDCEGALPFLEQADQSEEGNLKILRDKVACEKALSRMDQFYTSLQKAFRSNPFDPEIIDQMSEAHLYFEKYGKVISLYTKGRKPSTVKQRVALGVALYESNRKDRAVGMMKRILKKQSQVSPVVYYVVGMSLWDQEKRRAESKRYLETFLAKVKSSPEGYDPYHLSQKVERAKALISKGTLDLS